mgnify:CR=1 FL=1
MLLPIRSESKVRRFPLVTVSLIGLNILIFLFTYPIMLRNRTAILEKYEQLNNYELKISVKYKYFKEYLGKEEEMREKIKNKEFGLAQEEWEEWWKKYEEYKKALDSRFTKRFGFTPTNFKPITLISSLFLHASIGHLLFNMWFLWLVGCNIEDKWGRPFFLGFYIISGILASIVFALISQSTYPLIGASGAIAGVMGAFAVQYYNSKIYFLLIWLFPPIITTFPIYAGIFLPFWFAQQLFYGFYLSESSNVAFWAHVGGFGFGVLVVLLMKFYGLEEKFLKPLMDETLNIVDKNFSGAVEARSRGDIETAERLLREKFRENPANLQISEELIDIYSSNNREKEAGSVVKETIWGLRKGEISPELILSFYEETVKGKNLLSYLSPFDFYFISDLYRKKKQFRKASIVLAKAYKEYMDTNDAPYILLRLIKALSESKKNKFIKEAFLELKKKFPEMEEKAIALIKEAENESR